jgi:hypothetical protein
MSGELTIAQLYGLDADADSLIAAWKYNKDHFTTTTLFMCGKINFDLVDTTGTAIDLVTLNTCADSEACTPASGSPSSITFTPFLSGDKAFSDRDYTFFFRAAGNDGSVMNHGDYS